MLRNRVPQVPQAVALFVALTFLVAVPAHAQFGGLAKKAKQAAERAAEKKVDKKVDSEVGQATGTIRPSSTFGEELTETTFASLTRGLNAELVKSEQRSALRADADSANQRSERLRDAHPAEFQAYENSMTAAQQCRSDALKKIEEKQEAVITKRMMAPTVEDMARYKAMSDRYAAAQAKAQKANDAEGIARAASDFQRERMALYGFDARADSAAVKQQCPAPREASYITESKTLLARDSTLRVRIRTLDEQIAVAGSSASGMTPEVYALAKERVLNWSQEAFDNGTQVQVFGNAERKMFEAHKAEIRRLRPVLS